MSESLVVDAYQKGEREELTRWLQTRLSQVKAPTPEAPVASPAKPAKQDTGSQYSDFAPGEGQVPEGTIQRPSSGLTFSAGPFGYDPLFLQRLKTWAGDVGAFLGRKLASKQATPTELANVSIGGTFLSADEQFKLFGTVQNPSGYEVSPYALEQFTRALGQVAGDPASYVTGFPGGLRVLGAIERRLTEKLVNNGVKQAARGVAFSTTVPHPAGAPTAFKDAVDGSVGARPFRQRAPLPAGAPTEFDVATTGARDLAPGVELQPALDAGSRVQPEGVKATLDAADAARPVAPQGNSATLSAAQDLFTGQSLDFGEAGRRRAVGASRGAYRAMTADEASQHIVAAAPEIESYVTRSAPLSNDTVSALATEFGVQPQYASAVADVAQRVARALPETELKDLESAVTLAFARNRERGSVSTGVLFALSRAAAGAAVGSTYGDDPETQARNALIGAGLGSLMSAKLARRVVAAMEKPETRAVMREALSDESGALRLRFPSRAVGDRPSPNTDRMGAPDAAKRLVRGINEKLQDAKKLSRAYTVTHDETIAAALNSPFRNLEDVLGLDVAAIKPEELAASRTAARGVRDFVLEDYLETAARATESGDAALAREARQKFVLAGRVSQQVTDLETAIARGQEAGKIKSRSLMARQYDLDQLAREFSDIDAALVGTATDQELLKMTAGMTDRARVGMLAQAAVQYPQALWDIYYGLNLLGSPVTQVRNILGNVAGVGMGIADRLVGEIVAAPFRRPGTSHVAPGEGLELIRGIWENVGDAFRAAKTTARTGESAFYTRGKGTEALDALASRALDPQVEGTIYGKAIDTAATLARGNLRFMEGVDEFFKTIQFGGELRALARRQAYSGGLRGEELAARVQELINNPTKDMLRQAHAFALEQTFTKEFDPATLGGKIQGVATHPAARLLVTPFFRTPMRIAEYSTVHTPILNLAAKQFYTDIAAGGAKAELAFSKLATGGAMVGLVWWYAANGYITGAPPTDAALRERYEEAGVQWKSIYVPGTGKYYSYDNLEPLSSIVGTAATFLQMAPSLPDHAVQTVFSALAVAAAKNAVAKQYFQGVSDLSDVIESASNHDTVTNGLRFIGKGLASLVPAASLLRATARLTDDERRDVRSVSGDDPELREVNVLLNEIKKGIPGWSKTLPAIRNLITGEPIPYEGAAGPDVISPFLVTTNRNDAVLNEIAQLSGAGLPKELPRVIGGTKPADGIPIRDPGPREGVLLDDKERARLSDLLTKDVKDPNGDTLHASLDALIHSDEYKDASDGPDGDKARLIKSRFHAFLNEAETRLLDEYPRLKSVVDRRRLERMLNRLPTSQEDQKDPLRRLLQ